MAMDVKTRANVYTLLKLLLVSFILIDFSSACARTSRKQVSLKRPYYRKKTFRMPGKCEAVELEHYSVCSDLPYNTTFTPNILRNRDQQAAGLEAQVYSPLLRVQCSPHTKAFICSVFFPMCSASSKIVLPCRSLCESVRQGCEELLIKYGFEWPAEFGCHMFPEKGDCYLGDLTEDDLDLAKKEAMTKEDRNRTVQMIAMETTDSSDGKKSKGDMLEGKRGNDGDPIVIVLSNEDKDAATTCIEGDYNCGESSVRGYINGKTLCCVDGKQLAYESFCDRNGGQSTSCSCVYPKPPGPGC